MKGLTEIQTWKLTREATFTATSQGKAVVVTIANFGKGFRRLKIETKVDKEEGDKVQTLKLRIVKYFDEKYFEDLVEFVQDYLKSYRVVILK